MHSWATSTEEKLGSHRLRHLLADATGVKTGVDRAVSAVTGEYADPDVVADVLASLGKTAAASYVRNKLPVGTRARSGDLGEIIGAHFATEELGYRTIRRLRWKDHREMAMRGDDIIGVRATSTGTLRFLKGEVKSRARLTTATVTEADLALRRDKGRPSPHSLEFIVDRLYQQDEKDLARAILSAQLVQGIAARQVDQLLFTFTGSDPRNLLRTNTNAYQEAVRRLVVGLQVPDHQGFIATVYTTVIANA